MQPLFNLPTVMLCTGLMTMVVAVVLTFISVYEKRERALLWWCAGSWAASVACIILIFRNVAPFWLSIGLGNAVIALAYGLVWAGFEAFRGAQVKLARVVAGAFAWGGIFVVWPQLQGDFGARTMIISFIGAIYSTFCFASARKIHRTEQLPTAFLACVIYGAHSLTFLLRCGLICFFPIEDPELIGRFNWFSLMALEGFVQAAFSTFIFLILIRERSERRYRLAAEIDSLTGASSRRHFVEATRRALQAKPERAILAVLDLDWFKRVNDTYGHLAGDAVLRRFARLVASKLDGDMLFGRLGGEEFALLLPNKDEDQAAELLEHIRSSVESLAIEFNGNVMRISTSIGVASTEDTGFDFDHLMAGADNALYICKEEGRNRLRFFKPAMQLRAILDDGEEMRIGLRKKRISRLSVRAKIRGA